MRRIMLLPVLLCIALVAKGQDSIRIIGGKVIPARIIRTSPYEISYKRGYQTATRYYTSSATKKMSTSKITEIVYANGTRDTVMPERGKGKDTGGRYFSKEEFYMLGQNDAKLYYTRYNGSVAGTFLATFPGSPVLGLIVATSTSLSGPNPKRFTYPNSDYMHNDEYLNGYANKARRIKSGKVWTSWGLGCALTVATFWILNKS